MLRYRGVAFERVGACGADPLICAGRPRPALLSKNQKLATFDKPARGL